MSGDASAGLILLFGAIVCAMLFALVGAMPLDGGEAHKPKHEAVPPEAAAPRYEMPDRMPCIKEYLRYESRLRGYYEPEEPEEPDERAGVRFHEFDLEDLS